MWGGAAQKSVGSKAQAGASPRSSLEGGGGLPQGQHPHRTPLPPLDGGLPAGLEYVRSAWCAALRGRGIILLVSLHMSVMDVALRVCVSGDCLSVFR